jgi:cyclophilin family peptidyl-prolyl cis-trans isomerase
MLNSMTVPTKRESFRWPDNASHLDGQYTVFGNTIKGLDIVDKIANTPCGGAQNSTPLKKVKMKSVKIVPRSEAGL